MAHRGSKGIPMKKSKQYWNSLFQKHDRLHNGNIPIQHLVIALRNENDDIPDEVVQRLLKKADRNADNAISFEEFYGLVQSNQNDVTAHRLFYRYVHLTIPSRKSTVVQDHTDGEYEEEYSCNPPTLCMIIISLVEILLHICDWYGVDQKRVQDTLLYNPYRRKEAWRFLTYMFVHVGNLHLLVNLVVQLILGIPLEMVHGWWRVLIVYLSGVIAGSLGTSISDPSVYLAGASGGVYAIMAAHIATLIMNWNEMQYAIWQLLIFLMIAGVDVGSAVHSRYVAKLDDQIGYAAHLAGAIAGLLVGIYVLRNLEVHVWEKKIWWFALFIYVALMTTGIAINCAFPNYFPPQVV